MLAIEKVLPIKVRHFWELYFPLEFENVLFRETQFDRVALSAGRAIFAGGLSLSGSTKPHTKRVVCWLAACVFVLGERAPES